MTVRWGFSLEDSTSENEPFRILLLSIVLDVFEVSVT